MGFTLAIALSPARVIHCIEAGDTIEQTQLNA